MLWLFWRQTAPVGALVLVGVLVFCIVITRREARFIEGFSLVQQGAPYESVLTGMGEPSTRTDGTISVYGGKKRASELTEGCTLELWYTRFWVPERYAVCLNAGGEVLAKVQYASW
jgi:hypothetical protein